MIKVEKNKSLAIYTTLKLGGKAQYFTIVKNKKDLLAAIDYANKNKLQIIILGGGSNLLITGDVKGLVIKNEIKGLEIVSDNESETVIRVQSGEIWSKVVKYAVDRELYGLENTFHIPGTAGAAPIQNIGAYGAELKDCLVSLRAINLKTREEREFSVQDCKLSYRDSIFKKDLKGQYFILSLDLKFQKKGNLNLNYPDIKSLEDIE